MALNLLDYLLMLILVVGGVWGVMRGTFKVLVDLVGLYLGFVVSLLLYQPLAAFFKELLPALSIPASEALAFGLIMIIFVNALGLVVRMLSTPTEEKKRRGMDDVQEIIEDQDRRKSIGPVSLILGMILGLLVTAIWISLALGVIQFLVRVDIGGESGFRYLLRTSALVPVFNMILLVFYQSVSIWLPGDSVPRLFSKILQP